MRIDRENRIPAARMIKRSLKENLSSGWNLNASLNRSATVRKEVTIWGNICNKHKVLFVKLSASRTR